ncbi:hypothetical protein DPMN_163817 [Dreissena polymorpha]|uniref:Uncharacterized protein n=1 Tax=Dreissena polymorpha TaxID=45954 RepID=A0A9D4ERV7_DREPO|nr:hypothetical protein DPMN_163817 [Dreissena polymorpha]
MMAEVLRRTKAIASDDMNTLICEVVCDRAKKECMYGECESCRENILNGNKDVFEEDVTWFEWKTKKEVRTIKKGKISTEKTKTFTVKEAQAGTVVTLFEKFEDQLKWYSKHIFRVYNQYEYFAKRKDTIK